VEMAATAASTSRCTTICGPEWQMDCELDAAEAPGSSDSDTEQGSELQHGSRLQPQLCSAHCTAAPCMQLQQGDVCLPTPSAAAMPAQPQLGSTRPAGAVSTPLPHTGAQQLAPSTVVTVAEPSIVVTAASTLPGGAAGLLPQHNHAQLPAPSAAATPRVWLPSPSLTATVAQPGSCVARPGGAAGPSPQHNHAQLPAPSAEATRVQSQLDRKQPRGAVAAVATCAQFEGWQSVIDVENTLARRLTISESPSHGPINDQLPADRANTPSRHMLGIKHWSMKVKMLQYQVSHT